MDVDGPDADADLDLADSYSYKLQVAVAVAVLNSAAERECWYVREAMSRMSECRTTSFV